MGKGCPEHAPGTGRCMGLTVLVGAYAWFALVTTVVVTLAVVAAILLFERRRAQQIERDLGEEPPRRRSG